MSLDVKSVLSAIKSNPIAVSSGLLVVASLVCLIVVQEMGSGFISQVEKRGDQINAITHYLKIPVKLPSDQPDKAPVDSQIVINQAAIDYLKNIYGQMKIEYNQIWDLAEDHNRGDPSRGKHLVMLEGLFPNPGVNEYKLYDAKLHYKDAFDEMFRPYSDSALYPRMHAGPPLPEKQVNEEVQREQDNFLLKFLPPKNLGDLSPNELDQLESDLRTTKMDLLRKHAESIHLYAQTDRQQKDGYPFQIGEWALSGDRPKIEDVWEGQMGLWIQADIADAIARCNSVSNPRYNVIKAPIKRLIKIELVSGYVGSGSETAVQSGDVRLPDNFAVAATGRQTNAIYDVRHVWVKLVVDFQQLPLFFDALAQTNFITVLQMEFKDQDAYTALKEGYYYGPGDPVQVNMLLETIWLRSWTAKLMPDEVRKMLKVSDDPKVSGPGESDAKPNAG